MCGENDGVDRERSKNFLATPKYYIPSAYKRLKVRRRGLILVEYFLVLNMILNLY
jgi:hypothetical protein